MNRVPPKGAVWMLERFGIPTRKPDLMGDLVEEFAAGRSAAWYWRQALVAVAVALTVDIRYYPKLFLLRALLTGWVVSSVVLRVLIGLPRGLFMGLSGLGFHGITFIGFYLILLGWIVGRTHREYPGVGAMAWVLWSILQAKWRGLALTPPLVGGLLVFVAGLAGSVPAKRRITA